MTIKQSIQPLNEIMKYLYSSNLTDNRADPKQQPWCVCTRHLPSTGGE